MGLLIRDGAHLKVKDRLPIDKYLIWTATPAELGINPQTKLLKEILGLYCK